jgi:GxxExxY protein
MEFDPESYAVIGAALAVHRALGPGLLESAYQRCLEFELHARDIEFERQVPIPVVYRGHAVDATYRADFIVARRLVVEVKSVQKLEGIHQAQVLTYLKLTGLRVGLLLNFNTESLRAGTVRLVR